MERKVVMGQSELCLLENLMVSAKRNHYKHWFIN